MQAVTGSGTHGKAVYASPCGSAECRIPAAAKAAALCPPYSPRCSCCTATACLAASPALVSATPLSAVAVIDNDKHLQEKLCHKT